MPVTCPALRWRAGCRWAVVTAVALGLALLGSAALAETGRPPPLAVSADLVGGQLVLTRVSPASPVWDAGARPGDVVLAVDGQPAWAPQSADAVAGAATLAVRTASGHSVLVSRYPAEPALQPGRLTLLGLALSFAAIGSAVFLLAADLVAAGAFLAMTTGAGVALLAAIPRGVPWTYLTIHWGSLFFGVAAFLLFLVFPVGRLATRPGRALAAAIVGLNLGAVALVLWAEWVEPSAWGTARPLYLATLVVNALAACVAAALAATTPSPERPEIRRVLRLVALGTLAAGGTFLALAVLPALLRLVSGPLGGWPDRLFPASAPPLPPELGALPAFLFPASLGPAILSRQYPGLERVAGRWVVATTVWLSLLALYAGSFEALRRGAAALAGQPDESAQLSPLAIAALGATFPPAQAHLRRWLEQRLFHDVYDYAQALRELAADVARLASVREIAAVTLSRTGRLLDLSWAAIQISAPPASAVYRWGDVPAGLDLSRVNGAGPPPDFRARRFRLEAEGAEVGALLLGPKRRSGELSPQDGGLLSTLAPLVAASLQSALLVGRLETQVAALAERERSLAGLSRQLIHAQEEERRRLALELHDDPLQRLVLLRRALDVQAGERRAWSERPLASLAAWRREVDDTIAALRAICAGLRPAMLDLFGLTGGLRWLAGETSARSDLAVKLEVATGGPPLGRLPVDLELALYRVAQEALSNCLKHAQATAATLELRLEGPWLRLSVTDDGQPAGTSLTEDLGAGIGLVGMRERLAPWGGTVTLAAASAGGTRVLAEVNVERLGISSAETADAGAGRRDPEVGDDGTGE